MCCGFFVSYSYIYSEKADITASTAIPLMFAAKKYLLTGLDSACLDVLEKSISPDTVCTVLQQSVFFGEDRLKEKCLNFIRFNVDLVFDTDAFKGISDDVLNIIVSIRALGTTEKRVYESCLRWAKHQLLELGNEDPTDEEIRAKLGDVLYEIRFPTMTAEEFAGLTAHSQILTPEEKNDIYVYITTKEKLESLKFVADIRSVNDDEIVIKRLTARDKPWNLTDDNKRFDVIGFQTAMAVMLTGVGLYGGVHESTHDITLALLIGRTHIHVTKTTMTSDGSKTPVRVSFEKPILIPANTRYIVAATVRSMAGTPTWSGSRAVCDFEASGKISFFDIIHSTNCANLTDRQIPELYVVLA